MCTPVILADRFPPSTYDTPTSTCHVIIARAELRERRQLVARGDTRRAQHVASAACAVGRWTKVLGLVLSLESSAARVLTEVQ